MTLDELANFITTKVNDTNTDSVTACKSYINKRYKMIYEASLWTESLGIISQSVAASETETVVSTAPSITFYQSSSAPTTYADFVVAAKFTNNTETDGNELVGQDYLSFFQLDPNIWLDVSGRRTTPTNFVPLPKNGSGYARIRLIPTPALAGTLYVLAKLKFVELGDSDSPCLRGVDNALLAYGEAAMLERARQYGKAQLKNQEGQAMEQLMKDLERGQQQVNSVVVPAQIGDNTIDDVL